MLKLVATDMDGTWLNERKDFDHDLFKRLLAIMNDRGIKFVVASGNELENLRSRFPECADDLYYVAENGSLVAHGRQVMHVTSIPDQSMRNIMTIVKKYDFPFLFGGLASAYIRKKDGLDYYHENQKYYTKLSRIDSFAGIAKKDKILKASCVVGAENLKHYLDLFRKQYPENEFVSGGPISIDIQGKGMNKARGLQNLGKKLGISAKDMIAFGDSGNDEGMLKYVGHSYATATALPSAKKAADEIIGSSDQGAVQFKLLRILAH